jgi:hypothetical protein
MRLTTRLMQVASWLLVQRAVRDGEIQLTEAASEKYRLISREPQPSPNFTAADELPQALKALIIKGGAIYERVRRLDVTMYDGGETGFATAGVRALIAFVLYVRPCRILQLKMRRRRRPRLRPSAGATLTG